MKERIPILLSANGSYAELLLVTLKSLVESSSESDRFEIFLINRSLPLFVMHVIRGWEESHRFRLVEIDGDEEALKERTSIPVSFFELESNGQYDRLLAPFLISSPKCLYLDSDLLIKGNLTQLWTEDLKGRGLAAAQDQNIPAISDDFGIIDWRDRGYEPDSPYFNSGVMIIDLDHWRKNDIPEQCISLAREYELTRSSPPPLHDQYVLNVIFHEKWSRLDKRWNLFANKIEAIPEEDHIIHFAGAQKPFLSATEISGVSRYFSREAERLIRDERVEVEKLRDSLEKLQSRHEQLRETSSSLKTPNHQPVRFLSPRSLAKAPDSGRTVMVMPVLIRNPESLRFQNFKFLVRQYANEVDCLLIVEQSAEGNGNCIEEFLDLLGSPKVVHLKLDLDGTKVQKTSLINAGARHAFERLDARFVWQMDADIYLHGGAVENQLAALNSETVPVVRPLLYFTRLTPDKSKQILAMSEAEFDEFDVEATPRSHYQIVDLFGPGTIIFSRKAFLESGGMDESFQGWGWEDMDFAESLASQFPVHTLPLTGFHLHHEEDRMPTLENFEILSSRHREKQSPDDLRHEMAHTVFHNFQTKFCLIGHSRDPRFSELSSELNEDASISFFEYPVVREALPQQRRYMQNLRDRVIYTLSSKHQRFPGFWWPYDISFNDNASQQGIQMDDLLDFLVSCQFHIFTLESDSADRDLLGELRRKSLLVVLQACAENYGRNLHSCATHFSASTTAGEIVEKITNRLSLE